MDIFHDENQETSTPSSVLSSPPERAELILNDRERLQQMENALRWLRERDDSPVQYTWWQQLLRWCCPSQQFEESSQEEFFPPDETEEELEEAEEVFPPDEIEDELQWLRDSNPGQQLEDERQEALEVAEGQYEIEEPEPDPRSTSEGLLRSLSQRSLNLCDIATRPDEWTERDQIRIKPRQERTLGLEGLWRQQIACDFTLVATVKSPEGNRIALQVPVHRAVLVGARPRIINGGDVSKHDGMLMELQKQVAALPLEQKRLIITEQDRFLYPNPPWHLQVAVASLYNVERSSYLRELRIDDRDEIVQCTLKQIGLDWVDFKYFDYTVLLKQPCLTEKFDDAHRFIGYNYRKCTAK
jgi:hypothetical protein